MREKVELDLLHITLDLRCMRRLNAYSRIDIQLVVGDR